MAIEAIVTGNLLSNPVRKPVNTSKGEVMITEFRMMSDVWVMGRDGEEPKQNDAKTKPVQVTVWNERLAEAVADKLRSGMRVEVKGDMYLSEHKATDAERAEGKRDYADLRCDAGSVTLMLNRVESINMRAKAQEQVPA